MITEFFFFKQKTAYEVGLGIPADPLFRSSRKARVSYKVWIATDRSRARRCVEACVYGTLDFVGYPRFPAPVVFIAAVRSEERRVGKECRDRMSTPHVKNRATVESQLTCGRAE